MKKTGAWLLVYALEQVGVKFTFGIPSLQTMNIYDELNRSDIIEPILVTHELSASFMAEAIGRTSGNIGTIVVGPGPGITHALSGIGEAYFGGIPLLIVSGGVRRDLGKSFLQHQIDQHELLEGITKESFLVGKQNEIIPILYAAYRISVSNEPGPVFVEIPHEIQMLPGEVMELPEFKKHSVNVSVDRDKVKKAVKLLKDAESPGIFLGWGARNCTIQTREIAEILKAPVSTTLQGLSVFPFNHSLHTGMGFGLHSVPAAHNAFKECDCLLAVGTRFAEIPTGNFGVEVPENLIHVDINPTVFNKNYPAKIAIEGDAAEVLKMILSEGLRGTLNSRDGELIRRKIMEDKENFFREWEKHDSQGLVNPRLFFKELNILLGDDTYVICDEGNHTFLAAELLPINRSCHFISPTDFNSMGYATPGAIGVKLANPSKNVIAIVGDGSFRMTCLEMITASTLELGLIVFVFHDGELARISQAQETPFHRKTCTVLGDIKIRGIAQATKSSYIKLGHDKEISSVIMEAIMKSKKGQSVIVDVKIDYSKKTCFSLGVEKTKFSRFTFGEKFKFVGKSVFRKMTG